MLPAFPIPKEFQIHGDSNLNQWEYLKYLTQEGAKLRYSDLTPEIQERLDFELFTVKTMGFAGLLSYRERFYQGGKGYGGIYRPGAWIGGRERGGVLHRYYEISIP